MLCAACVRRRQGSRKARRRRRDTSRVDARASAGTATQASRPPSNQCSRDRSTNPASRSSADRSGNGRETAPTSSQPSNAWGARSARCSARRSPGGGSTSSASTSTPPGRSRRRVARRRYCRSSRDISESAKLATTASWLAAGNASLSAAVRSTNSTRASAPTSASRARALEHRGVLIDGGDLRAARNQTFRQRERMPRTASRYAGCSAPRRRAIRR